MNKVYFISMLICLTCLKSIAEPTLDEKKVLAGVATIQAGIAATASTAYDHHLDKIERLYRLLGSNPYSKNLDKIMVKFTKAAFRASAVSLTAVAGYTAGDILVEYDKNHWDGLLVENAEKQWEPAFKVVYKAQQAVTSAIGSK